MIDKKYFSQYINAFLHQNSMLNLVSKNDAKLLWEKHIFDSLSIEKVFEKYGRCKQLLDIGTGGGFPAFPIAIAYPEIEVFALDSIRKKINAIENLKSVLNVKNLYTICDRAENITQQFDMVTSRAVAPISVIIGYAAPLLTHNGLFVAYKSKKVEDEISEAKQNLKRLKLTVCDIIDYELPLSENHTRNLVVIKKVL